jgi:hypothetical protein
MKNEQTKNRARRQASRLVLAFTIATQLATAQQWDCRYPTPYPPDPSLAGTSWEGLKKSSYNAYIPGDHVIGGSWCNWYSFGNLFPFVKVYKADGSPVRQDYAVSPARVHHIQHYKHQNPYNPIHDASETRAYGAYSPFTGNLSFYDEDNRWFDCYLFHASGYGDTTDYHEQVTFPYSGSGYGQMSQAQVRLYGTAFNPLDFDPAKIRWDINVVTNYWRGYSYVTSYANVSHTCFPGHVVMSQNRILYHYTPPRYDWGYVSSCLVFPNSSTNMIVGLIAAQQQVPCTSLLFDFDRDRYQLFLDKPYSKKIAA